MLLLSIGHLLDAEGEFMKFDRKDKYNSVGLGNDVLQIGTLLKVHRLIPFALFPGNDVPLSLRPLASIPLIRRRRPITSMVFRYRNAMMASCASPLRLRTILHAHSGSVGDLGLHQIRQLVQF